MLTHQLMDGLPTFVVGYFGHAASIDNTDVSPLTFGYFANTSIGELTCDCGRFSEIKLAT
jgi:hypothetical protein